MFCPHCGTDLGEDLRREHAEYLRLLRVANARAIDIENMSRAVRAQRFDLEYLRDKVRKLEKTLAKVRAVARPEILEILNQEGPE
jgi:hypothetical protein